MGCLYTNGYLLAACAITYGLVLVVTHGLSVHKWLPIGSFCIIHGLLLVTRGLLQLQNCNPMVISLAVSVSVAGVVRRGRLLRQEQRRALHRPHTADADQ